MGPVFSYIDFRTYLRDVIEEKRKAGQPCSNRWFAMKMEMNSSSWLTSVLKGTKGLSSQTANKLSTVLKHSPNESKYFEVLVAYNQAKTFKDRTLYYQELNQLRKLGGIVKTTVKQFEFYSTWYHTVVWSLIGMHQFKSTPEDFEKLAAMISPPITSSQARKSVKLLGELGFVKINNDGFLTHTNSALTSGEEIKSLAVAHFQQETMRLAQEALDRHPREERYIGTATVGVSEKTFRLIKELLADVNNRIADIANADIDSDRVYQINLQAFPMSISSKKNGSEAITNGVHINE